jgi:integrase
MRGDGRIFLRGKVYWTAYSLRGTEYRESTGESDPGRAAKFLRNKLKQVHADEIGARVFTTPKACKLTVAELLSALKSDFELRSKDSPQNLSVLKRVDADFGNTLAVSLTSEKIDTYVQGRIAQGDAPATINRCSQILGQAYQLAIRRGTLNRAPYIRHLSEAGNARQGFFSEQELDAVVSHLPEDLRDFVRFAAATGMRKGEIASLRWSDIDGDVLTLRGENAKNGEARNIPLIGELASIIERRKAARTIETNGTSQLCPLIFHREGEPVAEFRKSWATATKKAQCPGKLFHDLRRYACRSMSQAGVPQQIAMRISGHKTASMFQRYNIVCTDDLRGALEKTEAYRATAAKTSNVVSMGGR